MGQMSGYEEVHLIDGWKYRQYIIAAHWLDENGIEAPFMGKDVDDTNYNPSEALYRHTYLLNIKMEWMARFGCAPLEGAMQVYNPDVPARISIRVAVCWTQTKINEGTRKISDKTYWSTT